MLIYAEQLSSRLEYIVDLVNSELFSEPAVITTSPDVFRHYDGVKINYSPKPVAEKEFHIIPHNLLFEEDIRDQSPVCFEWQSHKVFFQTAVSGDDPEPHIPFDIFAACFYLVSRYEEYLPHDKDSYGRYPHTSSLAYKEGFLQDPLVDNWLLRLQELLQSRFSGVLFRRRNFRFVPTYDIDIMYAYKGKGLKRNIGGIFRNMMQGQWPLVNQRIGVLRGKQRDPHDAYEWLDALHLYCRVKPIYFFLVAQQQEGYDRNLPTDLKAFQDLIKYYATAYEVGLHPSWRSSVSTGDNILKEEKEWMEVITDIPIVQSRQHYIKFDLPHTYERLIRSGIKRDYSMGYGSINGFRASISSPFRWFNLNNNTATDLEVWPFCFMDANAFYEQKLSPGQAYTDLMRYYASVKKVRGTFITIWHNNFLGTDPLYKGWRELYEIFMKEDAYWDAGA